MGYVSLAIQKQTFANKSEMNEAIKVHIANHSTDLPDTAIEILQLLPRYACKYPGVAFLKNATIAKLIGKSRVTVIRNVNKLVNSGIIEKVSIMREINGGNGSNLYVIRGIADIRKSETCFVNDTPQPIHRTEATKPTESSEKQPKGYPEPVSLLNYNKSITCTYSERRLAPTYKRFKNSIEQFVEKDERKLVIRLYGVYLGNTKALKKAYEESELIDDIDADSRTIIETGYIKDQQHIIEEQHDDFHELTNQIKRILRDVSDITAAQSPSTYTMDEEEHESVQVMKKLTKKLEPFTTNYERDEQQIEDSLQEIKRFLDRRFQVGATAPTDSFSYTLPQMNVHLGEAKTNVSFSRMLLSQQDRTRQNLFGTKDSLVLDREGGLDAMS
ncbi:helix-turn-helix domain-containing protein [Paraliobacillus ryukyuensis]|uniref:helix-turn-helix domain-containing protein n=1 Tax=Paraliobacillus ryukyuensis TaxID=200904 RepID=UPI0009A5962C|nr:T7SS effector LXG polymorphic toxin [Paraliobacillus ryukyuensis]